MTALPSVPIQRLLRVLRQVRVEKVGLAEEALHQVISDHLTAARMIHLREHRFSKGCRADFWLERGIVIEVKKRRPVKADLVAQIERYASCDQVRHIVVMLERAIDVPVALGAVSVHVVSMNAAWGIAV